MELDKKCQRLLGERYPDTCLFGNIWDLVKDGHKLARRKRLLRPGMIEFRSHAPCLIHGRECKLPDFSGMVAILGAPCVLFSRPLGA